MNILPEYFRLLSEASYAADQADNYDLYSEDGDSENNFQEVLQSQAQTTRELVLFIRLNGATVLQGVDAMMEKEKEG